MRRRLIKLVSALSLVLCIATSALWVRSYFVHDGFPHYLTHSGTMVDSWWGRLVVSRVEFRETGLRDVALIDVAGVQGHRADSQFPELTHAILDVEGSSDRFLLIGPSITSPAPSIGNGFGFHLQRTGFPIERDGFFCDIRMIAVPFWAICAVLMLAPGAFLRSWFGARRRGIKGFCRSCGYDLRATPGRCPECGTAAEALH